MDSDNNGYVCKVSIADQNGDLTETHGLGPEVVSEVVNGISVLSMEGDGPDTIREDIVESNEERSDEPCTQNLRVLADVHAKTNGNPSAEKAETKETKMPKPVAKIKSSNIKSAARTSTKKTDNTKETEVASNGTVPPNARPKQPVAKIKSSNERHAANIDVTKGAKLTPATVSSTHNEKQPKSQMKSTSGDTMQDEGNVREKSNLKTFQKGSASKAEGDCESVKSVSSADTKSHKSGKLPSYDFSFRCLERAEKRKEYYTKLEERIHAQEVEKSNQQAKSKENQEAEIKKLRKSLNFKATPMPNFYQEPTPPKVELKKLPTTRPRSPKLGRKKNPSSVEGDGDQTRRPARLSLDEKIVSQHKPKRGPASVQPKHPQRKSLPSLPSQKTRLSKTKLESPSSPQVPDNVTSVPAPIANREEDVSFSNPEFVPVARLDGEDVEVSDTGFAPVARVLDEDNVSEDGSFVEDEIRVRVEQVRVIAVADD